MVSQVCLTFACFVNVPLYPLWYVKYLCVVCKYNNNMN